MDSRAGPHETRPSRRSRVMSPPWITKFDVIALVYLSHEVQRFVVPALRVAHGHELNRCFVLAFLLYLRNIMGVYIGSHR